MHLYERKKSFIKNSYANFISEVITIDFWLIWHFDVKGTGWVGLELELSIVFIETVKIQYVSDPLHRYTNIGKGEIFHV